MASTSDNKRFRDDIVGDLLDQAIDWINSNMSPSDVFDDEKLIEYAHDNADIDEVFDTPTIIEFVHETCTPEEVFSADDLAMWAEENGWMRKPH